MNYGKIINGTLSLAPRVLKSGKGVHYHPSADLYLQQGFLPVEDSASPDDSKFYTDSWIESEGKLVRIWTESSSPAAEIQKPTLEARVDELSGRLALIDGMLTLLEKAFPAIFKND